MIVFFSGSRSFGVERAGSLVETAFGLTGWELSEVRKIIHGGAGGIDQAADKFGRRNNIEVEIFRPRKFAAGTPVWMIKAAYLERNGVMSEKCDRAVIIWDGFSKGTLDSLRKVQKLKKPHFAFRSFGSEPLQLISRTDPGFFG